jgi:hypothetical protein
LVLAIRDGSSSNSIIIHHHHQLGSLEGSTSSSDEGEYDTKDGDSLDDFLQGPSGGGASSSTSDEKRKQVKAKVRSLPDLASSALFAYLNGVYSDEIEKMRNAAAAANDTDDCCKNDKPSMFGEGVVSFLARVTQTDPSSNSEYALELAFRSRKSICVDTATYLQQVFTRDEFKSKAKYCL